METDVILKQLEKTILIGTYNTKHGVFYRKGSDSVLMYDVDCLCDEPYPLVRLKMEGNFKSQYIDENKYTAVSYDQEEGKGLPYHLGWSRDDLNDYLMGKLLLFQPRFYFDRTTQQYHMNLVVRKAIEARQDLLSTKYITIPYLDLSQEAFKRHIQRKKPLPLMVEDTFHYFICDHYLYRFEDFKSTNDTPFKRLALNNENVFYEDAYAFMPYEAWINLLLEGTWETYEIAYSQAIVDDQDFLEAFDDYLKAQGLYYEEKDVMHFHMGLKTSPLVILKGMMGSGRHSLVNAYIQFTESKMLSIDLNDELLGFLNPQTHTYLSSPSGFVEYLLEAKTKPNQNYFVLVSCLNQARIYPNFQIPLYNERLLCENDYPSTIEIPQNVFFVGFEEDMPLDNQVLDYAMVLKLHYVPLNERTEVSMVQRAIEPYFIHRQKTIDKPLTTLEKSFLDELHQLLEKCSPMMGVSYRSIHYLTLFLNTILKTDERQEAFDYAVASLILPKIKGPRPLLEGLMSSHAASSSLEGLLNKYRKLSDFVYTRKVILEKTKELDIYGYAR